MRRGRGRSESSDHSSGKDLTSQRKPNQILMAWTAVSLHIVNKKDSYKVILKNQR